MTVVVDRRASEMTPEEAADETRRRARAELYARGLGPVVETGLVRPTGPNVLVRAVLKTDRSSITRGVAYDAREACAHEILGIGPDVPASYGLFIGAHCLLVTAAGNILDHDDKTCRYWQTHHEDIKAVWSPDEVARAMVGDDAGGGSAG